MNIVKQIIHHFFPQPTGKEYLNDLPQEIISILFTHLDDRDKCRFAMTCSGTMICDFLFNDNIRINKIIGSMWFDRFTHVGIYFGDNWPERFPKNVLKLSYFPNIEKEGMIYHDLKTKTIMFMESTPSTIKYVDCEQGDFVYYSLDCRVNYVYILHTYKIVPGWTPFTAWHQLKSIVVTNIKKLE